MVSVRTTSIKTSAYSVLPCDVQVHKFSKVRLHQQRLESMQQIDKKLVLMTRLIVHSGPKLS